ncbi:MAG: DNA polymerase Y family protein [Rhodospirillales bacterium]|nr:DNA polymerase Y family protein [Rhodospirillales bacterium]
MARRVASLWLPRFATDRLGRLEPGLKAKPLAVAVTLGNRRLVLAANRAAEAGGVIAGLTLADARALIPHLVVAEHEPSAERRLLARLARWAERYTPWTQIDHVEEGAGAGVWLDLTGSTHLFGGEAALLEDLIRRLGRQSFAARAAVADTPGAAWALARYGPGGACIAPVGRAGEALAPLPVAALRLAPADAGGLTRLGFRRIGDLYALPRASLARRFGARTLNRLDQALGRAEEPVSPRRPETPYRVRHLFAEPIAQPETIARAVKRLLAELKPLLEADGMGARRLELICHRVDDTLQGLEIGTSRPTRDPDHLFRLIQLRLERIDPGFGIEAMSVIVLRAEAADPRQLGLEVPAAAADGAGDLAGLVDRIMGRLGAEAVRRLDPRDSHWPERAQAAVPVFAPASAAWPEGKARPPLLLPRPEPIEAVAILPESPPSQFRWRRRLHRVRAAEGPERIAPEWWRDPVSRLRDYYQVEDEDGRRFWLFREGLYGEAGAAPRWWLQGMQ